MENKTKTAEFFNAINEDLNRQVSAIMSEADSIKETQTEKFNEEAAAKSEAFYRREVAKITQSTGKRVALAEAAAKKEKLEKRSEIANGVFAKVAERLADFTQTSEYESFLVESAKRIAAHFNGGEIRFYLRENDMKFGDKINAAVVQHCVFEADSSIKIGGCKAVSVSSALTADDTLDCRLNEQRRWFYENSGLGVE